MSPPTTPASNASTCAFCRGASASSNVSNASPCCCTAEGYLAKSGLSAPARTPGKPGEAFSAATNFNPSVSFGDFSNAGSSFGASNAPTVVIVSANASCWAGDSGAFAKTPAAAARTSIGSFPSRWARRKSNNTASTGANAAGAAAPSASSRTSAGTPAVRPTRTSAAVSPACPALGNTSARAVATVWRISAASVLLSNPASVASHPTGASFKPAAAIARSARSRASGCARVSLTVAANKS